MRTVRAVRRASLVGLVAALAMVLSPVASASAAQEAYYIVNTRTGMMVEILAHDPNPGGPAILWPHYGGTSQQFTKDFDESDPFLDPERAWFLLHASHSGLCLRTVGYGTGAVVEQAVCSGDAQQLWRVRTITMTPAECANPNQCFGGTRTVLENYYDRGKRCLDAANAFFPAPPAQGTRLLAWDCIPRFSAPNAINQEWELVRTQDWGHGPVVH
jgi:hypothetical protein